MQHPFENVLAFEDYLPLRWESLSLSSSHAEQLNRHNFHLLTVLQGSEESYSEKVDDSSDHSVTITRLEAKVDLLTDLVAQLIHQNTSHPDQFAVRLSCKGMQWVCDDSDFAEGDVLLLALYIDERLAQPLKLAAEVIEVSRENGLTKVLVAFKEVTEQVTDYLDKTIFRYHRRQIANQKSKN